jgi:hypothetical protein
MPRKWEIIRHQKHAVTGILSEMSLEGRERLITDDTWSRTGIEKAIDVYRRSNQLVSRSTLRRWVLHYLLYGETAEETR